MSFVPNPLFDPTTIVGGIVASIVLAHFIPYVLDPHGLRAIPGPLLAKVSDAWLGMVQHSGDRSPIVHELHKKHGKFVRLAPNHISIADPEALQAVYGHGSGTIKSDFYDAFAVSRKGGRGVFNTRDRAEHTRKRKVISHVFSQKSILEFEPYVRAHVQELVARWDGLLDEAIRGGKGKEGHGWKGADGRLWIDCMAWYNYMSFDLIGDLAFGKTFGMVQAGEDKTVAAVSSSQAMDSVKTGESYETTTISAIRIVNSRGEYVPAMGVLPVSWRQLIKSFGPWLGFGVGEAAIQSFIGLGAFSVSQRLQNGSQRVDLLSKLITGKDETGQPMGSDELVAEALTQLIAGSDTISNSSCAITYYLARHPHVQRKLQHELDEALGGDDEAVAHYDLIKGLPYLNAVIQEGLRIHSTSGMGLPRVAPEGGVTVLGRHFPAGTTLSVPTYTIHRDPSVWGEDVDVYRPERWLEGDISGMNKAFNVFSFGPRACVGKNLAQLEMQVIVASIIRRYEFVLEDSTQQLDIYEGFLRKPVRCNVGVKRREV